MSVVQNVFMVFKVTELAGLHGQPTLEGDSTLEL